MLRKYLAIGLVLITLLLVAGLAGCSSGTTSGSLELKGSLNNQQQGIWTTGEGKIYVAPDVAVLTLGIESQESSVATAREKAAVAMEAVMKAIKAQGVEDKDIQTQYFNIYQTTRWNVDKEEITGYRVTNTVVVKVRKVEKAGDVIDKVVEAGGDLTRVNNINFTVDDPQPYYEKARDKAFDYAVAKAKQLAAKAGVKLGSVVYMNESSANNNYGITTRNYALSGDAMAVPATITSPSNISTGQLEISATVSLGYDISR
jgi:uncharacterized protein YggE